MQLNITMIVLRIVTTALGSAGVCCTVLSYAAPEIAMNGLLSLGTATAMSLITGDWK